MGSGAGVLACVEVGAAGRQPHNTPPGR
ncbi:MAG: hypothetical protein QOE70_6598, partial [Chthoniobacter sp.]|nr:hypothetical protein [Chthoniobacter sp.]